MKKIPVGIIGCTGLIGQKTLALLLHHPLFEVVFLASSEKSVGTTLAGIEIQSLENIDEACEKCALVFSSLPSEASLVWEPKYARGGVAVISSSSAFRKESDIPLIIPEINSNHLQQIPSQKTNRSWPGFIVCKPNCTLQSFLLPLWPLHSRYEIKKIVVTNLQAVSGSGRQGNLATEMIDNALPYIFGEEEKTETEPLKILGHLNNDEITEAHAEISSHSTRVPILNGHMSFVSVSFKKKPNADECIRLWDQFPSLSLPSSPQKLIHYFPQENRPQPRLDRDLEGGMAVSVGRLRPCNVLDLRFVALSHNLVRGSAGGGILIAEQLAKLGYLESLIPEFAPEENDDRSQPQSTEISS